MNDNNDYGSEAESVPQAGWEPPADLPDHRDGTIPHDAEFFHPPPKDIGDLISAYSTLKFKNKPTPMGIRLVLGAVGGAIGAGIGFGLAQLANEIFAIVWIVVFP